MDSFIILLCLTRDIIESGVSGSCKKILAAIGAGKI